MGRSPSWQATSLPSLVVINSGSEDIMILVCNVILEDMSSKDYVNL